jgi:hypothetical protein
MGLNLPDANYLDQMAILIKQDPSITVKQIARELKFADSKSVYYWLDKSNVGGINEFKRMVLGHKSSASDSAILDIDGVPHYLVVLPLFDWNPKQKNPEKEWHYVHSHPHPRGLFAVRVRTNRYGPWFLADDVLVVSKENKCPEGSWALLKTKSEFMVGKVINKQVVDPVTLMAHKLDLTCAGRIIHQQRFL